MRKARYGIAFKSISAIVFWLALFTLIIIQLAYTGFREAFVRQYSAGAFRIANTAALDIDVDQLDSYLETRGDSPEYRETLKRLDDLCNTSEATFIYVIRPDTADFGRVTFLFSCANPASGYTPSEVGYVRETTSEAFREKYRALYVRETDREYLLVDDNGYKPKLDHITAMIPLVGSDGQVSALLCVQRQIEGVVKSRGDFMRNVFLGLFLLIVLVMLGQGTYLGRVILRPIKKISDEANRFANENQPPAKKLGEVVRNRDEIGLLADSIDRMEAQVGQYVRDITKITAERERIAAELTLAENIQSSMLPHVFPPFPQRNEFDIYAVMDPAREVGGDFYDFFLVDDDHLCMAIADVSGKGVPAALFMMMSKIILQNCAMLGMGPAKALTKTNEILCANNQAQMFVTVWLGLLEISTGKLTAANAGHEYPAIRRAGGGFELYKDRHGLFVGGMRGIQYREYELQLSPGDSLFVYTDGVPEASDSDYNQFGTERMIAALNEAPDAAPEQILKNVRRAVDGFVREAEQFDDLTMLCVAYRGGKGRAAPNDFHDHTRR